jgi:hypothetical protein
VQRSDQYNYESEMENNPGRQDVHTPHAELGEAGFSNDIAGPQGVQQDIPGVYSFLFLLFKTDS